MERSGATPAMLYILFASETGTAEELAERVADAARARNTPFRLLPFDEHAFALVRTHLQSLGHQHNTPSVTIALVAATCGDGEVPRAARSLWELLLDARLPHNYLAGARVAVLAVGDSAYERFNYAGKRMHRRLLQLGALPIDTPLYSTVGTISSLHGRLDTDALPTDTPLYSTIGTISSLHGRLDTDALPTDTRSHGTVGTISSLNSRIDTDALPTDTHIYSTVGAVSSSNSRFDTEALPTFNPLQSTANASKSVDGRFDADAQHPLGHDAALGPFIDSLFAGTTPGPASRRFDVRFVGPADTHSLPATEGPKSSDAAGLLSAAIECNTRITAEGHWQDVRLVRIAPTDERSSRLLARCALHCPLHGQHDPSARAPVGLPGTAAVLFPSHSESDVSELIAACGWSAVADTVLTLAPLHADLGRALLACIARVQQPLTLRTLLASCLDIARPPRRSFFRTILSALPVVACGRAQMYRDKLAELASPEGLDLYLEYVERARRRPVHIVRELVRPAAGVPPGDEQLSGPVIAPELVADLFPPLAPRLFSLASLVHCPCAQPGCSVAPDPQPAARAPENRPCFELAVAVVDYRSAAGIHTRGVCSSWLAALPVGASVRFALQSPPPSADFSVVGAEAVLAVCAGTGVAPVRALVQMRAASRALDDTLVLFGCRSVHADCHFAGEMGTYARQGPLRYAALGSRDGSYLSRGFGDAHASAGPATGAAPRQYVDALVKMHAEDVRAFVLERGAHVVVCGNSRLPALVKRALADVLGDPDIPRVLELSGRFHAECW